MLGLELTSTDEWPVAKTRTGKQPGPLGVGSEGTEADSNRQNIGFTPPFKSLRSERSRRPLLTWTARPKA